MKDHYDFSGGERGKFFFPDAEFVSPVHLDPAIQDYFDKRAKEQGVTMSDLINEVLSKQIADEIEAAE